MLTHAEEVTLKRLARDITPMPVVNPDTGEKPKIVYLGQLVDDFLRRHPKTEVLDWNSDPAVEQRIKHVLRPKEKLMQFYSRVGLGRAQIMAMSKDEISRFVKNAELNSADDVKEPVATISYAPGTRPAAPRLLMV